MSKSYQPWTQDQPYLLPPSLRDWLPEDHLVWFVLDVVEQLDLTSIEASIQAKDARGQRPYDPQMMVGLLIYGYATGVFSSRKLAQACLDSVPFRVLAANGQPHFTTINEFRRVHREQFAALFVQTLLLCRAAGLVELGHVAIDGTKVQASASKHKAMTYRRMHEEEARLRGEVEQLLQQAEAVDASEDKEDDGPRLPEELQRREQRLQRLAEAKQALEAAARQQRGKALRVQAHTLEAKAAVHPDARVAQRFRTLAEKRRRDGDQLDPPSDDDAGGGGVGQLPRRGTLATPEGKPKPDVQRNFTDPESSLMRGRDGYVQAYNGQLAVDDRTQIIVAAGVTNQPADAHLLIPMLARVKANLATVPKAVTADAGYWNATVEDKAREAGSEAYVAIGRERKGDEGRTEPQRHMRQRLDSPEGRALYAKRKYVVEPVNGQIKEAQGFRRFSFRGLAAVDAEWHLVCLCHNLRKLFRWHRLLPQAA